MTTTADGTSHPLFKLPFVSNAMSGLDPNSPVTPLYSQMNSQQQSIINKRLDMFNAGVILIPIGFVMVIITMMVCRYRGIKMSYGTLDKPSKFSTLIILSSFAIIAGLVLLAFGMSFSYSKGDSVYQILIALLPTPSPSPSVTPSPSSPSSMMRHNSLHRH